MITLQIFFDTKRSNTTQNWSKNKNSNDLQLLNQVTTCGQKNWHHCYILLNINVNKLLNLRFSQQNTQ